LQPEVGIAEVVGSYKAASEPGELVEGEPAERSRAGNPGRRGAEQHKSVE